MKPWEYRNIPFAERVRMHIRKDSNTGCHIFEGRRDGHGYGQIKDKGTPVLVHRWIWQQANGKTSKQVLHKCDNPSCVNIDHLFVGTHADNMADKVAKGRSKGVPRGYAHKRPMAKLTNEKVVEIKKLLARGYRQCDIAKDFGVSRNIICDIAIGNTWRHVGS